MTVRSFVYQFDIEGADADWLNTPTKVNSLLRSIIKLAALNEVASKTHQFQPQGHSSVLILSESHIAVHTWPEEHYAYITLSSCKQPLADFIVNTTKLITSESSAKSVSCRELG